MKERGRGQIALMASLAETCGIPSSVTYTASKARRSHVPVAVPPVRGTPTVVRVHPAGAAAPVLVPHDDGSRRRRRFAPTASQSVACCTATACA